MKPELGKKYRDKYTGEIHHCIGINRAAMHILAGTNDATIPYAFAITGMKLGAKMDWSLVEGTFTHYYGKVISSLEEIVYLTQNTTTNHSSGCICKRCNSKNDYAQPNQADGTYICFECR